MTEPTFFARTLGKTLEEFVQLSHDQRAAAVRSAIPDLNLFFDGGRAPDQRDAPQRTRELAASLLGALVGHDPEAAAPALRERLVTDPVLRSEADRDQNVYLTPLFTRRLTHAVPDLIFQPVSVAEAAGALRWARERRVPVTLRGAASTAMGGSVPGDAGLVLDLSRLDGVEIDAADRVCVVGAGARLRTIHQKLAERGLALRSYPSNLGGTLVGWFVTGGIGMNAFGCGRALDSVRAADLLLPSGEHLRFHDDGRIDVPDGSRRVTLSSAEGAAWFRARGCESLSLADLAGSEGALGLVLHVTVAVEELPSIGAFLLSFESESEALEAASWTARLAGRRFAPPANLKFLSASHLHHTRRVWADEDAREWKRSPSALSSGATLPWRRIAGPGELGAATSADREHAGGYLFLDFFDLEAARAFASALPECPGHPAVLGDESVRFAAERFKPQQTKRLGPGLIAAEVLLPAEEVKPFLAEAAALARNIGTELDGEVYYLADGQALAIAGYLTDHRSGAFMLDLVLAPVLLDLAMSRHRGAPYVLGRWQSPYLARKLGARAAQRVQSLRAALDPDSLLNRGVLVGPKLHGARGALLGACFVPGVSLVRRFYGSPALAWMVRGARAMLRGMPGPASGRGAPAPAQAPEDRALHCVNCGECNTVCPIFNESKIRLPQMLTHLGEAMRAGEAMPVTGSVLLDLCMRCGNCEEVCQAGIPHLALYERMQESSDRVRRRDSERHAAIVAAVRGSPRYTRDFLHVRPGGYIKRSPASLPRLTRYVLLRSENDAGPAASCIHCGACVAVCPTHANREYEGSDPRWITTVQQSCIGCGTCVEVCPANLANGGQTLRVMEAPTPDWFAAIEEFELGGRR